MFRKPFAEMHFSQAGMQCAANMERQARNRIKRGDIYRYVASLMFGAPEENITPAMRKAAKAESVLGAILMNWDKKITLARAVRNWPGGIAEITLVWRCYFSKLGIEYRQVNNEHDDLLYDIPDHCVKDWLWIFARPQGHLSEDSYYITLPPSPVWLNIINAVRA